MVVGKPAVGDTGAGMGVPTTGDLSALGRKVEFELFSLHLLLTIKAMIPNLIHMQKVRLGCRVAGLQLLLGLHKDAVDNFSVRNIHEGQRPISLQRVKE